MGGREVLQNFQTMLCLLINFLLSPTHTGQGSQLTQGCPAVCGQAVLGHLLQSLGLWHGSGASVPGSSFQADEGFPQG